MTLNDNLLLAFTISVMDSWESFPRLNGLINNFIRNLGMILK